MIRPKTMFSMLFTFLGLANTAVWGQAQTSISYELGMSQPETHYFEVTMQVNDILTNPKLIDKEHLLVKMPVWTPGSYLIREYAKNVEGFEAKNEAGKTLSSRKINKNTWEIELNGADDVRINYDVYAYELTVRTSFLDAAHGYVNGACIFMFVPQLMDEKAEITVKPFKDWATVSTALTPIGKNKFMAKDYDAIVDSPIEIGNHEVWEFEAAGVPHKIAMFSTEPLKIDKEKYLADFKKMTEAATSVVGETPLDHYLFIIHHQQGIGGGLEHLFSTTCQTKPNAYETENGYKDVFSLFAHEYFHLWNVKRIRPVALGPFDYEKENYTHMLWVAEGFTSFYEEVILARAGIINEADVLDHLATGLNNVMNTPGNKVQSATDASWDAWIKYYRPNENSSNVNISYYSKGGVLATLLNAKIIAQSKAEKSLDDVLRLLYDKYYKGLGRGYTDEEFQAACEEVYGGDLDYFFENYVSGIETADFAIIYKGVGLELINTQEGKKDPYLGVLERGGVIARISSQGSAYHSGINVGDKIISIDGKNGVSISDAMKDKKVGDSLEIKVERAGVNFTFKVPIGTTKNVKYELSKMKKMNKETEKAYHKFMNI